MRINGKTILVTGAGGGIGKELVIEIINRGGSVIAVDINVENLEETKSLVSDEKIKTFILDITNKQDVEHFTDKMKSYTIDGLINNAGIIQPFLSVENLDYSVIERVMNINFYGTLYLVKFLLPQLKKREEAYIVNMSSMGGFLPVPGQGIYGAAKAGVKLMTEALRAELINTNIGVSVVFPGAVNTNIKVNSGIEDSNKQQDAKKSKMILSPQKAAQIIITGIEKNKPRILVGKDAKMMDFLYRLSPGFASKLIAKKMADKVK